MKTFLSFLLLLPCALDAFLLRGNVRGRFYYESWKAPTNGYGTLRHVNVNYNSFPALFLSSSSNLHDLSRAELQALAKTHGIKANGKSSDIIAELQRILPSSISPSTLQTTAPVPVQKVVPVTSSPRTQAPLSQPIDRPGLDDIMLDQGVQMADIFALRDAIMKAKEELRDVNDIFTDDSEDDEEEVDPSAVASFGEDFNSANSKYIEEMLHREAMALEVAAKNKAKSDGIKQRKIMEREERIALQRRQREQKQREEESIKSGNSMLSADSSDSSIRKLEGRTKPVSGSSGSSSGAEAVEVPVVTRWQSGAVVSGAHNPSSSISRADSAGGSADHESTTKVPYQPPTDGVKLQIML